MTTGGPSNPDPLFRAPAGDHSGRVPDDVVDAFFDRELDAQRSRDLLAGLRNDPARSEDVARTQRMLTLLRRTPILGERSEEEALDAIMARVAGRRRFLPEAWRRFVTAGRLAAAATLLLAGLGVAVLGRTHPNAVRLSPPSAPIATLVDTGRTEASAGALRCGEALEAISERATAPLFRQFRTTVVSTSDVACSLGAPDEPLKPGVLATVRFADHGRDLELFAGSGEPQTGTMGASFSLGLELVASRQRSGDSAPVLVPMLSSGSFVRPIDLRSANSLPSPSGLGLVACQAVTIGDHTVTLPATLDPSSWIGGPDAARRLLLISVSPADQFPSR